ncbi:MAG: 1,4-alpha-glucan branching protein GlgB [bacterium]
METTLSQDDINKILHSDSHDPFQILGIHEVQVGGRAAVAIRAFLPEAREASVVALDGPNELHPMRRVHDDGFFEAIFGQREKPFPYQLELTDRRGQVKRFHDPYSFLPILTDYDLYLFGEGSNLKIYEKMGSHILDVQGVEGVHFAVWAPNARRVSVVGDFNNWDGRRHQMRVLGSSGVWEIFIPGLGEGEIYKYEIKTRGGHILIKSDPYASLGELRPKTASITYDINKYQWGDREWMENRGKENQFEKPIAIYEVHLGSWMKVPEEGGRPLNYREMAEKLVEYVDDMGFTHIELLPISEHPLDASWGYQTTGYFAPTSRYGPPEDFMYFVDTCHRHGIGVIIDWVPAHFPKDAHALAWFDGTFLYEHADPKQREHPDWGTMVFNYGRNEVRNFLLSSAFFWFEKYHIDGIRVDAVASMLYLDYSRKEGEWIPNKYGGRENLEAVEFLRKLNEVIYAHFPGALTIAEESTAWPAVSRPTYLGGLGFGFKWNMGWMHDILEYMSKDPIHRKYHHNNLTFGLLYAFHENFILVLSHDEVVHGKASLLGKMPGDVWQKFANLRLLYGFMYGHPGKKHLFMGGEIGQWNEWNHDRSLDWHLLQYEPHKKLQKFLKDLNRLYRSEPALCEVDFSYEGFEWIDFHDTSSSVISFIRRGKNPDDFLVFVLNFTPVPRYEYRIGVPRPGFYRELLNSDSEVYWGSNIGNCGGVQADPLPWHWKPYSLNLTLPPLSALILKPVGQT